MEYYVSAELLWLLTIGGEELWFRLHSLPSLVLDCTDYWIKMTLVLVKATLLLCQLWPRDLWESVQMSSLHFWSPRCFSEVTENKSVPVIMTHMSICWCDVPIKRYTTNNDLNSIGLSVEIILARRLTPRSENEIPLCDVFGHVPEACSIKLKWF